MLTQCQQQIMQLLLLVPFLNWQTAPLNESHLARSQFPITGSKMPQSSSDRGLWNNSKGNVWFCEEFPSRRESGTKFAKTVKFPSERNGGVILNVKLKMKEKQDWISCPVTVVQIMLHFRNLAMTKQIKRLIKM